MALWPCILSWARRRRAADNNVLAIKAMPLLARRYSRAYARLLLSALSGDWREMSAATLDAFWQ